MYNQNSKDHHYTIDQNERDILIRAGWKDEGIGWYSDDSKTIPLYRQYNPNAKSGNHNYTTNKEENDRLGSIGWKIEGIGWYALKEGEPVIIVSTSSPGLNAKKISETFGESRVELISGGPFGCYGISQDDKGNTQWKFTFDKEGNVLYKTKNSIFSFTETGYFLQGVNNSFEVKDINGNEVKTDYLSPKESIVKLTSLKDKTYLWSIEVMESINGDSTTITIRDLNTGKVELQFSDKNCVSLSPAKLKAAVTDTRPYGSIRCVNEGVYLLAYSGVEGIYVDLNQKIVDQQDHPSEKTKFYVNQHEGLSFKRNVFEDTEGVFRYIEGNKICSIHDYEATTFTNDHSSSKFKDPRFINGYSVIPLRNSQGVKYWGVLNKSDAWMFEPIKGTVQYIRPSSKGLFICVNDKLYNEKGEELNSTLFLTQNGEVSRYSFYPTNYSIYPEDQILFEDFSITTIHKGAGAGKKIAKINSNGDILEIF